MAAILHYTLRAQSEWTSTSYPHTTISTCNLHTTYDGRQHSRDGNTCRSLSACCRDLSATITQAASCSFQPTHLPHLVMLHNIKHNTQAYWPLSRQFFLTNSKDTEHGHQLHVTLYKVPKVQFVCCSCTWYCYFWRENCVGLVSIIIYFYTLAFLKTTR